MGRSSDAEVESRLLAGRYRAGRRLGTGGMASVFLAKDEVLEREVAVKRLHPSDDTRDLLRFRQEARVGAALRHPNLVTVYDRVEDESGALIVMEYIDGHTLATEMEKRMKPERAVEVLGQVAAALDHAHDNGVIHRDVKPANVLIGKDGTVKLADLGIASASDVTRTVTGAAILGTLAYMAPERLRGSEAGPAADVYSLAMVAFEALSGTRGRVARTPGEAVAEAVTNPPPDLASAWPEAPPAVSRAIARGLAAEPGRRQPSAGELVEELATSFAEAADGTGATAPTAVLGVGAGAGETIPPSPSPDEPPTHRMETAGALTEPLSRRGWGMPVWIAASIAVAIAVAIAIGSLGGGGEEGLSALGLGEAPAGAGERSASDGGDGSGEDSADSGPAANPAVDGTALGDEGFALMQEGEYEAAIPVLARAVRALDGDTSSLDYAYALYNLGASLLYAGRPEDAIPVLERRLEIPNQTDEVQATLDEAYAAVGDGGASEGEEGDEGPGQGQGRENGKGRGKDKDG